MTLSTRQERKQLQFGIAIRVDTQSLLAEFTEETRPQKLRLIVPVLLHQIMPLLYLVALRRDLSSPAN